MLHIHVDSNTVCPIYKTFILDSSQKSIYNLTINTFALTIGGGVGYGVKRHFQQYFSYIVAVLTIKQSDFLFGSAGD